MEPCLGERWGRAVVLLEMDDRAEGEWVWCCWCWMVMFWARLEMVVVMQSGEVGYGGMAAMYCGDICGDWWSVCQYGDCLLVLGSLP